MVNRYSALLICCLFMAGPTLAETPEFWDADPVTVQKVDAEVAKLNFKGFSCPPMRIEDFARNYDGFTDKNGRRMIVGQLLSLKSFPRAEPGIHIVRNPMSVADGGCSVANVWFEADTLTLIQAVWGGR
jgi:hypothetical protein